MTITVKETERQRLREVAHDYQERGYQVVVEPNEPHLPDFLSDYRPDLVARNGHDNVIVEVRSFPSLVETESLSHLAQAIQAHENWRLELVVPPVISHSNGTGAPAEGRDGLSERLSQARGLLDQGYIRAAMLMTLPAVETAVRLFGEGQGNGAKRQSVSAKAKHLLRHDLISQAEYQLLLKGLALRHAITDGDAQVSLDADTISALIVTSERLVSK